MSEPTPRRALFRQGLVRLTLGSLLWLLVTLVHVDSPSAPAYGAMLVALGLSVALLLLGIGRMARALVQLLRER